MPPDEVEVSVTCPVCDGKNPKCEVCDGHETIKGTKPMEDIVVPDDITTALYRVGAISAGEASGNYSLADLYDLLCSGRLIPRKTP